MNPKKYNKVIAGYKQLQENSTLHPVVKDQVKQRILSAISQKPGETESPAGHYTVGSRFSFMHYVMAAVTAIVMAGAGTVYASQNSLPGDALYSVKLAAENVQLGLAVSTEAKANLESEFATRRANELAKISAYATTNFNANADASHSRDGSGENISEDSSADANADAAATINAKNEVRDKARNNMSRALNRLHDVQAKLEAQGNATAAASVQNVINRLETRTEVRGDSSANGEAGGKDNGRHDNSSPNVNSEGNVNGSGGVNMDNHNGSGGNEHSGGTTLGGSVQTGGTFKIELGN
jgi:uncharacterized protein DUF5667